MRGAIAIATLLMAFGASGSALAQGIVVGPRGVGVYDDRPRSPPPYYGEREYGPRPGYGPPPPPQRYGGQVCAYEGGFCSFRGYATVRYGARGSYVTRQARDGIPCNNRVFGDPAYGLPKRCIID